MSMLRLPESSPERGGVTAAATQQKSVQIKGLGTAFARLLQRELPALSEWAGCSVELDNKVRVAGSEWCRGALLPARDPEAGANDSTHKGELDPLEMSLSVPLGGAQPIALTPVSNALHDASSGARPLLPTDVAMIEAVVRRISWGGDRRRGAARIELGGAFTGTTIVVHGEGRTVDVDIELAPGSDAGVLPARLAARLAARGLEVRSMDVR